jgi:predicted GTPase
LVDTPGYNPSGVHTKDDVNITKSLLRDANAIIWLIGLDSNGTVPKSDLDFLESVNLEGKELYVVLNKADIRPMDDLEDIIEEVAETLEDFDIEFEGISAYSSVRGKEFLFDRKSLFEFFEEASWFPATKHSEIKNKIAKIKNAYKEAILNKIEENKKLSNSLHSIGLDILESGVESDIYFKIEELKSIFYEENSKLKRFLKELENVFKEINWEIDDIFKNNN